MSKILRLTGMNSFASPNTYGLGMKLNQRVKVRDSDAVALLATTTPNPAGGAAIAVFTDIGGADFDYDVSSRYAGDLPLVYDPINDVVTVNGVKVGAVPDIPDSVAQKIPALVSRAGKVGADRPVYCSIGNSISRQSGPGYGVAYSTEFYSDIQWALALTGHGLQPVRIGGSTETALPSGARYSDGSYGWSSATSVSIAADLPNFLALIGAVDVFFVHTMENDAPSANSVADTQAAYDSIISQLLAKGATLIYWKQHLPNTGINTAGELSAFWALCKYMEAKAASVSQLRIVPTYDMWTDSSNAYPVPLNAGLFANYTDGTVHPRKGGLWLGKRLAEYMERDGFSYAARLDIPGAGNPGFIAGSANMVGTGGVFSGGYSGSPATPPTGITISSNMASVTVATANAAVFDGRPCIEITAAAGAQSGFQNIAQVLMATQSAGWAIGDTVQFLVEYVIDPTSVPTGFRSINLELRLAPSGSAFVNRRVSGDTYNEDYLPGRPVMLATPLLVIPAATTSIRPLMTAQSDATNAVSLKFKVLSFRVINWSRVA